MRILYYNSQLGSFDGSNSHAAGMLCALRRINGEENVLVANRVEQQVYARGRESLKRGLGPLLDPLRAVRRKGLSASDADYAVETARKADFEPDVVLARCPLYDEAPLAISKELGARLVMEVNTPLYYECCDVRHASMGPLVRAYESRMLRAAAGVYCVSDEVHDMLEGQYGHVAEKSVVVPNGYDAGLYSDFEERGDVRVRVRAEEGVEGAFVVTFVGSLQSWHGIDRLVEIADGVKRAGGRRVIFWVMGDGEMRGSVEARSKVDPDFRWFGNVSAERMKELLYASDLGVMPYERLERFYFSPLKMYDMIGAGLPYIGLSIGQIEKESPAAIRESCLLDTTLATPYADKIIELRDGNGLEEIGRSVREARASCTWDCRARELTLFLDAVRWGRR